MSSLPFSFCIERLHCFVASGGSEYVEWLGREVWSQSGGLWVCSAHCLCSCNVPDGRTSCEQGVGALQSYEFSESNFGQVKLSHWHRCTSSCMSLLSILSYSGRTDTLYGRLEDPRMLNRNPNTCNTPILLP